MYIIIFLGLSNVNIQQESSQAADKQSSHTQTQSLCFGSFAYPATVKRIIPTLPEQLPISCQSTCVLLRPTRSQLYLQYMSSSKYSIVYFRNRPWIIVLFSLSENKTIIHGLLRK